MEDSQAVLKKSLEKSGVSIPGDFSSIAQLTPEALVSICAQSLNLIEGTASFSTVLPDSMADRFRICADIALAVKNLGYIGDMTYYKFLYPSEEDMYKLVRFLVERLSESLDGIKASGAIHNHERQEIEGNTSKNNPCIRTKMSNHKAVDEDLLKVEAVLKDLALSSGMPTVSNSDVGDDLFDVPTNEDLFSQKLKGLNDDEAPSSSKQYHISFSQTDDGHVSVFGETFTSFEDQSSKIKCEIDKFRNEERVLREEVTARDSEILRHEEELQLLKMVADRVVDNDHPIEFHLEQLNEQLAAKKHNIANIENQWKGIRQRLEEKKRSLEETLYAENLEAQNKLQKLREIELHEESVYSETRKRVEELAKLQADLEKQPKVASRRSYIERIKEITKNSRKLDGDIQRILRETRDLQVESNSFRERLHRTYALVDELISREAKMDPAGQQVYRLLTNIHGVFEQISEKILKADRVRREVAEHEKKLATIASRGLDVDKLQMDVDAIVRENERLEENLARELN